MFVELNRVFDSVTWKFSCYLYNPRFLFEGAVLSYRVLSLWSAEILQLFSQNHYPSCIKVKAIYKIGYYHPEIEMHTGFVFV